MLMQRCLQRSLFLSATWLQYRRSNTRCPCPYWETVVQLLWGTYLVHSSRDWTSICWKVQISSRFPRINATSELLSLKHTVWSLVRCVHAVFQLVAAAHWRSNSTALSEWFVLVSALKSSQVICQEALKILRILRLGFQNILQHLAHKSKSNVNTWLKGNFK